MRDSMIKKIAMIAIYVATIIVAFLNVDIIIVGALVIVILIATLFLGLSTADLNR